jgi:hypothetical protein
MANLVCGKARRHIGCASPNTSETAVLRIMSLRGMLAKIENYHSVGNVNLRQHAKFDNIVR